MRPVELDRRTFLAGVGALAATPALPSKVFAASPTGQKLHGLSAFGELKYAADFRHFDYVNPDAPKGGRMNFAPPYWRYNQGPATFNTLNSLVLKGDSPPRTELCFDTLMASALDEPDSVYGLLAESVTISEDRNIFEFKLRPQARWHDGTPLTAEDVAFCYQTFKDKGHPDLLQPLRTFVEAKAVDAGTVRLVFDGKQSEQNILTVVGMPIISKAYYTANDFEASSLKPPLGSGPYKIGAVSPGTSVEYERVADYWGKDLPVNIGSNNFDRIRIDFYQDRQPAFEALKKGDTTFREEHSAGLWANEYNFPAVQNGKVIKRAFDGEKSPEMQGLAINTRRPQFRDIRVRRAIALCFDFEWTSRTIFHGLYERTNSFFAHSEFEAKGLPPSEELALLEPFRAELPPEAFGEPVVQPVSNGTGRDRKLLTEASKLLTEAGWKRDGSNVRNDKGETLKAEFLVNDERVARVFLPCSENMKAVGIEASVRVVDATQFAARENAYDFDLNLFRVSYGSTPTDDTLEALYHSRSADRPGTRNYPGTKSPAVDALIAAAGRAKSRAELGVALRALDRVLRARLDWIPTYGSANHRVAYWDMFGFKEPKPDYGFPVETLWWFDETRAKAIGKA